MISATEFLALNRKAKVRWIRQNTSERVFRLMGSLLATANSTIAKKDAEAKEAQAEAAEAQDKLDVANARISELESQVELLELNLKRSTRL